MVVALCVSGCAFVDHEIVLQPQTNIAQSTVGSSVRLFVRFVDERADQNIGNRAAGNQGARISARNLPSVTEAQLRDGLARKGYQIVTTEQGADAVAVYRLRGFSFSTDIGFFTGGQNQNAVLAVDASRAGRTFTKVYRYETQQRVIAIAGEGTIDMLMNTALADILQQALSDAEADSFLTS